MKKNTLIIIGLAAVAAFAAFYFLKMRKKAPNYVPISGTNEVPMPAAPMGIPVPSTEHVPAIAPGQIGGMRARMRRRL